jgi:hypothetical protein
MLYLNAKITVQTQAVNVLGVNDLLQNSFLCNTLNYVSFLCFYVEGTLPSPNVSHAAPYESFFFL